MLIIKPLLTKSAAKASLLSLLITLFYLNFSLAQEPVDPEHAISNEVERQVETVHDAHEEAAFNVGEMIMHHVSDDYGWHFADGLVLPLPIILRTPDRGFEFFSSNNFHNPNHQYDRYTLSHGHISYIDEDGNELHPLDLSITKNVASLLISAILLLVIFLGMAKHYRNGNLYAPKGIGAVLEPLINFIVEDIAKGNIGPKYQRFVPYLLTVFFFIWINNLLGLLPGGANLTGNIAVTLMLAVLTFLITIFNGNKTYWGHIFSPPGVPLWLLPIMIPVEIIGMFTKPFSLMVRLFANITAGHIIILSLFSLIFIFKSFAVGPVSVAFATIMNVLELLVAFLQAYIFTLLSAMYFGTAVEEHDHEHEHAH